MDDFKAALEKQMKKASTATPPPVEEPVVSPEPAWRSLRVARSTRNANRVTINLFETDKRALAVVKELLDSAGHDFTSRSDSIKVALRLAAKARPEDLTHLYEQIKSEDGRFRQ